MSVSLSKGGNVSLSKEAPGLTRILVGLGWDVRATDGAEFDLTERALVPPEQRIDPEDAAELAEAQHDMRQLARDIAASDVSPATLRRRQARTRKQSTAPHQQDGAAR